jgi:hypothetical protein
MTLNTNVWLLDPHDPNKVWDDVMSIVAPDKTPIVKDEAGRWGENTDACRTRQTQCGQGLDAWTSMTYKENITEQFPVEHYEDSIESRPAHYIHIDFDTSYGFKSEIGSCSELHASYIISLVKMGYQLLWMNEYTGDIYYGITGIESLLSNGVEAMEWFNNLVVPAIQMEVAV